MDMQAIFRLSLLFLGAWLSACGPSNVEQITIRGSDTEVNLVLNLSEQYMQRDSLASISVTGGGSGSGIAALINDKTDIASSSRAMEAEEMHLVHQRGIKAVPIIFAIDALAVIVHPDNPIKELSTEQIGALYSGDIDNWAELGGPDQPVSLYGRQSNSGTFSFFREHIVKAEYSPRMKQMNGTAQIVESIKQDPAGIGYVGIGYVVNAQGEADGDVKILAVSEGKGKPAYSPTNAEAIIEGDYTITRPLYQYINGVPSGSLLDFLEYELSEEGQRIVRTNGYFPINDEHRAHNQNLGVYASSQ